MVVTRLHWARKVRALVMPCNNPCLYFKNEKINLVVTIGIIKNNKLI